MTRNRTNRNRPNQDTPDQYPPVPPTLERVPAYPQCPMYVDIGRGYLEPWNDGAFLGIIYVVDYPNPDGLSTAFELRIETFDMRNGGQVMNPEVLLPFNDNAINIVLSRISGILYHLTKVGNKIFAKNVTPP